ncbi:hypothetical protein AB6A40_005468 [Gnathostoma spinigerum]|uniref:Metallo-beta-lactamase domain-containing protein n=1 Tax=Gnathostoma spinigerum TaxID=75299 RepID=A0ABD6EKS6_9BILA
MQLTSLSWMPYRPCLLLRLPSACILLDCAVDLSPLSSFVPFSYTGSHSFSNTKTSSTKLQLPYLKKEGDKVFVDGPFEVHPVSLLSVAVDSIDAIIVSNWMSLFALPFFTENTAFQGTIYATDPTVQIGKLIMEEYLTYIELVRRDTIDDRWKNPQMFGSFSDLPSSDPRAWVQFYHRKQMENSLSKIKRISFRQRVDIDGTATIAAYSSGYSIGSCNWVIQTENEKVCLFGLLRPCLSQGRVMFEFSFFLKLPI